MDEKVKKLKMKRDILEETMQDIRNELCRAVVQSASMEEGEVHSICSCYVLAYIRIHMTMNVVF